MSSSSHGAVLVTGGTGYLGERLARRFLQEGDSVILWLHAQNDAEARKRTAQLRARFGDADAKLDFAWGDLTEARPFSRVEPAAIRKIVHTAAITSFNIERSAAKRVNVDGAAKLFQFAETCPSLITLGFLSTVYSAGLREGDIAEEVANGDEVAFANQYEWSKHTAERDLVTGHAGLPWNILRIATAIADDDSGTVVQHNAFHNTLKLLFYGLLSLLPGDEDTPLYFVTGAFVVDAVWSLLQGGHHGVYHVCHRREHSLSLRELVEIAFTRFEQENDFRDRGILRPLLCDARSFGLLGESVHGFGGPVLSQGLRSIVPFSQQLFSPKSFNNDRLIADYDDYRASDPRNIVKDVCDYLVRTRWGKRSIDAH